MSHPNSKSKTSLATLFPFSMRDLIVTALILFVAVEGEGTGHEDND